MLSRLLLLLVLSGALVWYRRQSMENKSQLAVVDGGPAGALSPEAQPLPGPERIAAARAAHQKAIAQRCLNAGLPYPPRELFLRAFKQEGELEAWGREDDGEFRRITVFSVTQSSGKPGPKRREGDLQVPEGCYRIAAFNPESSFHLSLGLDYPNASDRILSDREKPGFDIYIHGGAVSVGCLPLGDDVIDELYLLAADVKARGKSELPVHIFPMRMDGSGWDTLKAGYPEHVGFWKQLEPIYAAFERTHQIPNVEVDPDGSYRLK